MPSTLNSTFHDKLADLPGNAQVALGLACAERALDAFAEQPEADVLATMPVYDRCQAALRHGWAWETRRGITPQALYAHLHPLLACEYRYGLDQKPRLRDALFAVVSAMYFTTWKADGYAYQQNAASSHPLPNDIADVTLRTLAESLDYATQAAIDPDAERHWQYAALNHLLALRSSAEPGAGDPPIPPAYFDEVAP